jgi:ubiquinone/menaquinone biosynthesis C-methylase UbiE
MTRQEAERWEAGCKADQLRNAFIVPQIVTRLQAAQPLRIIDVGCGTGYVARAVDDQLVYCPEWTLLDINSARLQLCDEIRPHKMRHQTVCSDILKFEPESLFDAALLTFTMIEIADAEGTLAAVSRVLRMGGALLIALPDSWEDAIQLLPNDIAVKKLLDGRVEIPKTDKFTGAVYPFYALRIERAIQICLAAGFVLSDLIRSVGYSPTAYLLQFVRSDRG